jgi:CheY-like chemotaxis protein
LVVEDEEALRRLAARVLEGWGYSVLTAETAVEALEVLAESKSPVDLLLTDVVLPGTVQGHDLASSLLATRPDLPMLFMSGYTRNATIHSGSLDEGVNFLEKPPVST